MPQFKTLDDTKPVYTEEELQRFEVELRDKEVELGRRAETLRQEQELLKERSKALEAQKREYQQVGNFMFILLHFLVFVCVCVKDNTKITCCKCKHKKTFTAVDHTILHFFLLDFNTFTTSVLHIIVFFGIFFWDARELRACFTSNQAVMEMSQKQKEQQAVNRQPPSGPNGELQFQNEIQKLANEDSQGEKNEMNSP